MFDTAREGFTRGEIVWKEGGSIIKAHLVRGYTYAASHKFVSDVVGAGGTIVATTTLSSLTSTNGVLDAADAVWPAVPAGASVPHCIFIQASAVTGGADVAQSQQRLILCLDRGGLPLTPNGQNVNGAWSPGVDRIARF